jgi:hypothetical protein
MHYKIISFLNVGSLEVIQIMNVLMVLQVLMAAESLAGGRLHSLADCYILIFMQNSIPDLNNGLI